MFKDALQAIVEGTEGGLAGLLMDSSGIPLETYSREGSQLDINNVGIEFSVVIGAIKRASEMLDAGATQEIAIGTERLTTIIRTLGDGYFLAIELVPDRATRGLFTAEQSEWLLRGYLSPRLFEAGLICRADDRGEPVITLSPPLIAGEEEFVFIESVLRRVLTDASHELARREGR